MVRSDILGGMGEWQRNHADHVNPGQRNLDAVSAVAWIDVELAKAQYSHKLN